MWAPCLPNLSAGRSAAALALLLGVMALSSAPLAAQRTVRVGLHDARPVAFEIDGEPTGFGVVIVEEVARRHDWELEWVRGTWAECMQRLEEGELDLLFPMLHTPERDERFDFSEEGLFPGWGRVVTRTEVPIETLLDLEGRRVGVVARDIFGQELERQTRGLVRPPTLVPYPALQDAVSAAERGEVDAVVGENLALHFLLEGRSLRSTTVVVAAGPPHMAVRAGHNAELLAAVDETLADLKADPGSLYHQAYDEWLGIRRGESWPAWLPVALTAGAALLALALLFAAVLRSRLAARTRELVTRSEALLEQIRERERAETERRVLRESLRHAQKLQLAGQLASGVAHDVRNLLTVIAAHAERVREVAPAGSAPLASLDVMECAAREAADMTRSLVAFSRKIEARPEKVDLGAFVRETGVMIQRTLPESVKLHVSTPREAPFVLADPSQLRQVVLNLAVNAREAMPDGGRLELEVARPRPRSVRLRVSDTGQGMDAEVRDRVFEPFFTTKEATGGTGLGLATVREIVQEQDGTIEIDSTPGEGTTISVTWAEARAPLHRPKEPGAGRGETVLLLVRTPQVRQIVASALLSAGFEPRRARTLAELGDWNGRPAGQAAALLLEESELADDAHGVVADLLRDQPHLALALLGDGADGELPDAAPADTVRLGSSFRPAQIGQVLRRLLDARKAPPRDSLPTPTDGAGETSRARPTSEPSEIQG